MFQNWIATKPGTPCSEHRLSSNGDQHGNEARNHQHQLAASNTQSEQSRRMPTWWLMTHLQMWVGLCRCRLVWAGARPAVIDIHHYSTDPETLNLNLPTRPYKLTMSNSNTLAHPALMAHHMNYHQILINVHLTVLTGTPGGASRLAGTSLHLYISTQIRRLNPYPKTSAEHSSEDPRCRRPMFFSNLDTEIIHSPKA